MAARKATAHLTSSQIAVITTSAIVACSPALPQGQYGPYFPKNKALHLASGEVLAVYRVKILHFSDSTKAVQIEYEPPFAVADTEAVRREARTIWPAFAPYVESNNVEGAVITATNLHRHGIWPLAWTTTMNHYGVLVRRRANGTWYIDRDSVPLPAADLSGPPQIIDVDGNALPFTPDTVRT